MACREKSSRNYTGIFPRIPSKGLKYSIFIICPGKKRGFIIIHFTHSQPHYKPINFFKTVTSIYRTPYSLTNIAPVNSLFHYKYRRLLSNRACQIAGCA